MIHDDPRKLAKPIKAPHTAEYKQGKRTECQTTCNTSYKSIFNGSKAINPCLELEIAEAAHKKGKKAKTPRLDPYMVRQAKLRASHA